MTRGGTRKGAGRPEGTTKEKKVMVSLRLPKWLADWLKRHARPGKSQSNIVEKACREYYEIKRE